MGVTIEVRRARTAAAAGRGARRRGDSPTTFHRLPCSLSPRHSLTPPQKISPGDGKTFPKKGDRVTIHYVGTLLDGSKFDSSRDREAPFQCVIGVGQVIKGWDEGVPQLSLGEKAILTATRTSVPPRHADPAADYAYGPRGFPPVIVSGNTHCHGPSSPRSLATRPSSSRSSSSRSTKRVLTAPGALKCGP
ncbi:hypothetical protein VHUM_01150 [Vanrija humicola]|uniref:peptidylprolyl isomerase n=1 Tax=Vanrija humicola TaxID=5417 RepID=A0A7D8V2X3_VANHU|nr:hypothetical protein VHUM_01150 [Vanrija humicola]